MHITNFTTSLEGRSSVPPFGFCLYCVHKEGALCKTFIPPFHLAAPDGGRQAGGSHGGEEVQADEGEAAAPARTPAAPGAAAGHQGAAGTALRRGAQGPALPGAPVPAPLGPASCALLAGGPGGLGDGLGRRLRGGRSGASAGHGACAGAPRRVPPGRGPSGPGARRRRAPRARSPGRRRGRPEDQGAVPQQHGQGHGAAPQPLQALRGEGRPDHLHGRLQASRQEGGCSSLHANSRGLFRPDVIPHALNEFNGVCLQCFSFVLNTGRSKANNG